MQPRLQSIHRTALRSLGSTKTLLQTATRLLLFMGFPLTDIVSAIWEANLRRRRPSIASNAFMIVRYLATVRPGSKSSFRLDSRRVVQ